MDADEFFKKEGDYIKKDRINYLPTSTSSDMNTFDSNKLSDGNINESCVTNINQTNAVNSNQTNAVNSNQNNTDNLLQARSERRLNLNHMLEKEQLEEVEDRVFEVFFNHIIIVFIVVSLILLSIFTPWFAGFFGILGIIFSGMLLINSFIVYLYGRMLPHNNDITLKKCLIYMIPVSVIIVFIGRITFFGIIGSGLINGIMLLFLFKFEDTVRGAIVLNAFLVVVDVVYLLSIGLFVVSFTIY